MDLLNIWATWIFDRYERVKESLTYTFHFLFTQPCDASDGNYLLSSGKQAFVFIKAVSKICSEQCHFFSGLWALVWFENATAEGSDLFLER